MDPSVSRWEVNLPLQAEQDENDAYGQKMIWIYFSKLAVQTPL